MKNRVAEIVSKIQEENLAEVLRGYPTIKQRYVELISLFGETLSYDPISARQLVYYLHHKYRIDLGVCPFYSMDDKKQYCSHGGITIKCSCVIPEMFCVFRGEYGKDMDPQFFPYLAEILEK